MNLNATLFAQMIVFLFLSLFIKKFIWPVLIKALDERSNKIAEGLNAAKQSKIELDMINNKVSYELKKAHNEGLRIINVAKKQADFSSEKIKEKAHIEAKLIIENASKEIERQIVKAREDLKTEISDLVIKSAEYILSKEINKLTHIKFLSRLKTLL